MERYKGIKRHEVPPHVFAITDSAYRSMLQGLLIFMIILKLILYPNILIHKHCLIFHLQYIYLNRNDLPLFNC